MKKILFLIIVVVFALFGISYLYLGYKQLAKEEWFVNFEEVRGSSVIYDNQNYTLNFDQQKKLCEILNQSTKVRKPTIATYQPTGVEQIVIYLFKDSKQIILTPAVQDDSLFKVSIWNASTYLEVKHPQEMHELLKTTYDR